MTLKHHSIHLLCPWLVTAVPSDCKELLSMIVACESYLSPLCTYITSECCLQTTPTRLISCVNLHHYLAPEDYRAAMIPLFIYIFICLSDKAITTTLSTQ